MSYLANPSPNSPNTVCRIGHSTTRSFACAAPSTDPNVGFDLNRAIAEFLSTQRTLNEWISQSDEAIRVNVPLVLDHVKRDFPGAYTPLLGNIIVDCAFASWGAQPALTDDVWRLNRDGTLGQDRWQHLTPESKNSVVIGARDAIESHLKRGPPPIELGIPKMLESLIRFQIDEGLPDPRFGPTVGLPISILRLDGDGPYWEAQGVCEK